MKKKPAKKQHGKSAPGRIPKNFMFWEDDVKDWIEAADRLNRSLTQLIEDTMNEKYKKKKK